METTSSVNVRSSAGYRYSAGAFDWHVPALYERGRYYFNCFRFFYASHPSRPSNRLLLGSDEEWLRLWLISFRSKGILGTVYTSVLCVQLERWRSIDGEYILPVYL